MPDPLFSNPPLLSAQNWKLVLAYDGTDYRGWQVQPGLPTVQGELARAIREVTGETVLPQGSGRTDTGVHAEGQVVSVALRSPIPQDRLGCILNRRLHSSIRVVRAEHAAHGFHARASVESKTYEYRIFPRRAKGLVQERTCPPWLSRYVWDCRWPLDVPAMQEAAFRVQGTHDFTSFAAHDPDRSARAEAETGPGNVRTIFHSEWLLHEEQVHYRVCGSGFLHHMVRNLVGTFIEIGTGARSGADLPSVLAKRDRSAAGFTAPPQGLFLKEVKYRATASTPMQTEPHLVEQAVL